MEGPSRAAMAGMHAEDTGPLRSYPVRHLSFAVRGQRPGRIAAAVAGGLATSRGGLGREPGGPGVGRPDRGVLFVQHDEQRFHVLAQRSGVCRFGASGHGLSVANAAPPEHDSRVPSRRQPARRREEREEATPGEPIGPGERGETSEAGARPSRRPCRRRGSTTAGSATRRARGRPTRRPRRSSSSAKRNLVHWMPWKATSWGGT